MVYLIYSTSYHLLEDELNKIFKDKNDIETIDYNNSNINEIINIAGYTSLFNDSKNIIVKNFDLSAKDLDILEKYIESPNPLTTLVFTTDKKIDERKKIVKLLKDKKTYINIKPLNYKDISQRLMDIAKKNGYTLYINDANYITFASLSNYDIAYNQLQKIFLYYNKPCDIEKRVLENLISQSIEDNNFKFVDTVIKRNIVDAMKMINDFKLLKIEPLVLVSMLAKEYRNLLISKDLYQKGYSNQKIKDNLGLLDWQVDKLITNTYNYSINELENKLLDLTKLDYELKTSKIDKYLGLEMFILKG